MTLNPHQKILYPCNEEFLFFFFFAFPEQKVRCEVDAETRVPEEVTAASAKWSDGEQQLLVQQDRLMSPGKDDLPECSPASG